METIGGLLNALYGEGGIVDTSKEYIEMCAGADEVQTAWEPQEGDFISYLDFAGCIDCNTGYHKPYDYYTSHGAIWLPRQDQLQNLIFKGDVYCYRCHNIFCGWITTTGGPDKFYAHIYKDRFSSMEQLWLAFVMKDSFGKMWDGKEWI